MRLSMGERRVVVKAFAARYRASSKGGRTALLDEFVAMTGYNRSYASWLLRMHGRRVRLGQRTVVVGDASRRVRRRRRQPRYGPEVVTALKRLWKLMDYMSGKRLKAALPQVMAALERHGELGLDESVRGKLETISAATIDRLLAPERRRLRLKHRGGTKPGTLLKHQIPVRTFAEWSDTRPGFVEVDLVDHDGGVARGEYARTLCMTDVATGWTELGAVPNKAQVWVFAEIKAARARLPFPLLGLDSDNGSEFINHHLQRYCEGEGITFTRTRPYRKNDNCYVEQKNWSVVRRFVGHGRMEGEAAVQLLRELYEVVRLYVNCFAPSVKLVSKERDGSRVVKRYDAPQTPLQRILASPHTGEETKQGLRAQYATLNPAALRRHIDRLQRKLLALQGRHARERAVDAAELWKAPPPTPPGFPHLLEIPHPPPRPRDSHSTHNPDDEHTGAPS